MRWFSFRFPLTPKFLGWHRIHVSYMGHDYGDERTGMYLEISYNGKLYGRFYKLYRLGDMR